MEGLYYRTPNGLFFNLGCMSPFFKWGFSSILRGHLCSLLSLCNVSICRAGDVLFEVNGASTEGTGIDYLLDLLRNLSEPQVILVSRAFF